MATGVGTRISERRKSLNLSQKGLANRLGLKSKSTICKIERGDDNLTADTISKYAEALNTSPAYLMGWVSDPSPEYINSKIGMIEQEKNIYEEQERLKEMADQALENAMALYEKYKNAPADIQSAVETLLKSVQREP